MTDHFDQGGRFDGAQRVTARKTQFRGEESVFRQLFVVAENARLVEQPGHVFHVDSHTIKVRTLAVEIGERLISLMARGIEVSEEENDRKSVSGIPQIREAVLHLPGGEDVLEPARVVDGYSRKLSALEDQEFRQSAVVHPELKVPLASPVGFIEAFPFWNLLREWRAINAPIKKLAEICVVRKTLIHHLLEARWGRTSGLDFPEEEIADLFPCEGPIVGVRLTDDLDKFLGTMTY